MNPTTLLALADLAARLIDTSIRQAEAREAAAVQEHADRLAATHAAIVAIDFGGSEPREDPEAVAGF